MIKKIEHIMEIQEDITAIATLMPEVGDRCMGEVIDVNINYESMVECPISQDGSHGNAPGFLRGSWVRDPSVKQAGRVSISFGYTADYAFWVHEIPPPCSGRGSATPVFGDWGMALLLPSSITDKLVGKMRTALHRPPAKWKFLEDPVNSNIDLVSERIADEIDNIIMTAKSVFKERLIWGELESSSDKFRKQGGDYVLEETSGFSGYVGRL
jgi:hypothetical protein